MDYFSNSNNKFLSKSSIILYFVIIVILVVLVYIYRKLNLKKLNCSKLNSTSNTKLLSITDPTNTLDTKQSLSTYYIKTAYNCCCTGNFKNDYVDICALKNCAFYGVRALDFQIYSLKNKPIVSASSVKSTDYKEIYNYIDFYEVLNNVRKYFIDDQSNKNCKDPLFLIFRLYTKNTPIYDMMAQALNQVYGYGSPLSNILYTLPSHNILDNVLLSSLAKKVVIIVDPTYGDKNGFENSQLNNYSSLVLGSSLSNTIYRESTILGVMAVDKATGTENNLMNNLTILYPELQQNKNNYDFITSGIFNYVSFIGMNFQYNDAFLREYNNTFFASCAFISKLNTIQTMCSSNTSYSSTKFCKAVNSFTSICENPTYSSTALCKSVNSKTDSTNTTTNATTNS